jgi:hypothetical protein
VVTAPRRRNAKRAKRGWLCLGRPRRRKPRGLAPRASRSTCPCARHEAARPRASSAARACLNSTGAAGACSARCRHAALAAIRADRATRLTAGTGDPVDVHSSRAVSGGTEEHLGLETGGSASLSDLPRSRRKERLSSSGSVGKGSKSHRCRCCCDDAALPRFGFVYADPSRA